MLHTVIYYRDKRGNINFYEVGWQGVRIKRDIYDLIDLGEEVHLKPEDRPKGKRG